MNVAILNFSGNVGKTTLARHLLAPRIAGAQIVSIETANADALETEALRGKDFLHLQEHMLTTDDLIVDVGASNIEDLLGLMHKFTGSHQDFDYFIIPVVPDVKQQRDSANTAAELVKMGVPQKKIRFVLNRAESEAYVPRQFSGLLAYLEKNQFPVNLAAYLRDNEIYQLIKDDGRSINDLAADDTDYKALIAKAQEHSAKIALVGKLAVKRLADGVLPELDACFKALALR